MAKDYQKTRSGLVAINKDQNIVSAGDLSKTKQDVSLWSGKGGLVHNKGWAVCDGSTYDPLVFPELDDALGNPVSKVVPNGPYKTKDLGFYFGTPSTGKVVEVINGDDSVVAITEKSYCYARSDVEGNWFLYINLQVSITTNTANTWSIKLANLTIDRTTAISSMGNFTGAATQAQAFQDSGSIEVKIYANASVSNNSINVQGELPLTSKPTWADANLEDYPIIATANNVLSNSLGLPEATSQGAGLLTLDQNAEGNKNYIINGGFDFWQRATSQTTNNYGSADRYQFISVGTTHNASRQSFALGQTDVPNEPDYYLRDVITSVSGAGNFSNIEYRIEKVKTLAGQKATLSFYAKADAVKNIVVEFGQDFGTGGSPSADNYFSSTTISLSTNWNLYTVNLDFPSLSGKTLGTDNNDHVKMFFWFDAGSNWDSRTNSLGQQSGTFDIAQVKLEEGSQASKFTRAGGTYAGELALCQRYFNFYGRLTQYYGDGQTGTGSLTVGFPTSMRASGSVTYTINAGSNFNIIAGLDAIEVFGTIGGSSPNRRIDIRSVSIDSEL